MMIVRFLKLLKHYFLPCKHTKTCTNSYTICTMRSKVPLIENPSLLLAEVLRSLGIACGCSHLYKTISPSERCKNDVPKIHAVQTRAQRERQIIASNEQNSDTEESQNRQIINSHNKITNEENDITAIDRCLNQPTYKHWQTKKK